jgi:hypothetical protein
MAISYKPAGVGLLGFLKPEANPYLPEGGVKYTVTDGLVLSSLGGLAFAAGLQTGQALADLTKFVTRRV